MSIEYSHLLLSQQTLVQNALREFTKLYDSVPTCVAIAPGRVNIIGEHTDYNEGFVLPMALPLATVVVGSFAGEGVDCEVTTLVKVDNHFVTFKLHSKETPLERGTPQWANYVKGVVVNFGFSFGWTNMKPFKCVVASDVPLGGGLSSSASLEIAIYTFLEGLFSEESYNPDCSQMLAKALSCQKAEHDFALVPCGIMDQFISTMARKGDALLIDCRSLDFELVPLSNSGLCFLITNSNVKHTLSGSEYPTRRKHCEEAAKFLGKKSLREASIEELEENKDKMSELIYRRARHVIGEIQRTTEAVEALKQNDFKLLGSLMFASHKSLRDDFQVSCSELDNLVDAAMTQAGCGVFGSRMTGGGFGGCTVTLVAKDSVNKLKDIIKQSVELCQPEPSFIVATPEDGCRIVTNFL